LWICCVAGCAAYCTTKYRTDQSEWSASLSERGKIKPT